MVLNFKDELVGERIVLRRTIPTIEVAKVLYDEVDRNREYLRKWLPWPDKMNSVEDELKYLFDNEKKFEKGDKIEYGIYLGEVYLGNIGIFDIDEEVRKAEIGYWLSEKFGRKGYMTEAVRIVEAEFFNNLGLNRIQIKCDEENVASAGVAKKCGYTLEGTLRQDSYNAYFGRFRDTLVFSKLKAEYN